MGIGRGEELLARKKKIYICIYVYKTVSSLICCLLGGRRGRRKGGGGERRNETIGRTCNWAYCWTWGSCCSRCPVRRVPDDDYRIRRYNPSAAVSSRTVGRTSGRCSSFCEKFADYVDAWRGGGEVNRAVKKERTRRWKKKKKEEIDRGKSAC